MSTIKVFALGGLDQKSNDLTRAIDKASEMINCEYDTQSTIRKRNGFSEVLIDGSNVAAFNDLVYYNSKDEILGFTNGLSTVKIIKNGTTLTSKTLNLPSGIPSLSNVSISYCENQNNLYFTNTDYSTYVMKYDGSNVYRSGLPTPRVGDSSKNDLYPGWTNQDPTLYTRMFYSFKDINGNITYSPYYQNTKGVTASSVLTINSLKLDSNCIENGFLDKFCYIVKTGSSTISSSSRTLTVTRHNYVAGEKFIIDTENKLISISPQGKNFIILDVESVTSTSITFTATSLSTYSFILADGSAYYASEYPVDIRTQLHIYTSAKADVNYINLFNFVIDNSSVTNSIPMTRLEAVLSLNAINPSNFEDIYDSAYLKIMPPICKFIASFGEQIVYGSVQSYFTGYTNLLNAPNQKIDFANTSLITYSDKSTGDGPEGTSDFNFTKIGETWDGDITGMKRCNDALIIFKTRGVFSIDGNLVDGQYSLRKINTNFAGCTSHKSILDTDEGLYYQSHNGLYFTNGVQAKKMTYEIDPLYLSSTYLNTRAVRLKKKQKSLFYVDKLIGETLSDGVTQDTNPKIVVIDYYYNQIYIWNAEVTATQTSLGIVASSGIIEDKNGDVYFCNGSKLFKFNDLYTDNGLAIPSLYSTTWHHAGEPSLNKKWLSIRMFGLTNDSFTANIKTEGNWERGTYLTNNDSSFISTTQTDFKMLDMQTKRSLRITFSNSNNNENMVLTGYELTYEAFNNVDKN